ncbi:MAG: hypothetical protein QHH10_14250 [Peptococcaceae bacterium]|jgi:hypothetical protein|nr:hypothetical protein [Peptococcaceae bacterium]MDH7526455.1 hypothetical protein [Peptococcaceae bacterium]
MAVFVLSLKKIIAARIKTLTEPAGNFFSNERGEMVGTIGWMAVTATILVLVHGLVTGWLPGFINRIFSRLDTLV